MTFEMIAPKPILYFKTKFTFQLIKCLFPFNHIEDWKLRIIIAELYLILNMIKCFVEEHFDGISINFYSEKNKGTAPQE